MRHYHFVGIGGIGMGTLASLLLDQGEEVSGSDVRSSPMTEKLSAQGARIDLTHDARNVEGADCVVYSSAVRLDNPELQAARMKGILIQQRAQLLAQLMTGRVGITIAGAHGKTTTTSMISNLLLQAGLDPTTAVGGVIRGASYGAHVGRGKYFVSEVDESDGSFLYFRPTYAVITNVDFEHVDFYHNWENILDAYRRFIQQTDPGGRVIICAEDERLKTLTLNCGRPVTLYGLAETCDVHAQNIRMQGCTTKFDCFSGKNFLGAIQLIIPGQHNVLNALAAVCVGLALEIDFSVIAGSFLSFQGVNRRFQIKGRVSDVVVVDDYGHHPTEIAATLKTARSLDKKRVLTVFQPHRYSRTKFLMEEFVKVLASAENLIVTDIYAASEPPIDGITGEALCTRLEAAGHKNVRYVPRKEVLSAVLSDVQPEDLVLTLGAGDITRVSEELVAALEQRFSPTGA